MKSYYNTPVIINNFNRLKDLKKLVHWLEEQHLNNIYILDNNSSYPPLLEYYQKTRHTVIFMKDNLGYLSLWKSSVYNYFKDDFFIYTDPDVLPVAECPSDWLKYFYDILNRYQAIDKIGFGIKIDDLPDVPLSTEIIKVEEQYWQKKVEEELYDAPVDTTFALYRPNAKGGFWTKAYRSGYPYIIRHLPWYETTLSEEDIFYKNAIDKKSTHWSKFL